MRKTDKGISAPFFHGNALLGTVRLPAAHRVFPKDPRAVHKVIIARSTQYPLRDGNAAWLSDKDFTEAI